MNSLERRIFNMDITVKRSEGVEGEEKKRNSITGHAAVFNARSENLGGFVEVIAPGAFDEVLDNDVRCVFNHDPNIILGRTVSGTLKLKADSSGLQYECEMPETQVARDLLESMARGDITQSSFSFEVAEEEWEKVDADTTIRTIIKVKRLHDVSPVTYPAYPDATSGISERAINAFNQIKQSDATKSKQKEKLKRFLLRQKLGV